MKEKRRSTYNINFKCEPNLVDNFIKSYILSNGFVLINKDGENYYRLGGKLTGYKCFSYKISEQTITIEAWFSSDISNYETPLEVSFGFSSEHLYYRNILEKLFVEISKLDSNVNGINNIVENNNIQQNFGKSVDSNIKEFQDNTLRKKEKMCEWAFWITLIVGIFTIIGGYDMDFFYIYFCTFPFGIYGLKTSKKYKAIAIMLIPIISVVIAVLLNK